MTENNNNDDNELEQDDMKKTVTHTFENSSTILRADYDTDLEAMKVFFRSGTAYAYVGVPKKVFKEFCMAESAGTFLVENVKGTFDYMKMG